MIFELKKSESRKEAKDNALKVLGYPYDFESFPKLFQEYIRPEGDYPPEEDAGKKPFTCCGLVYHALKPMLSADNQWWIDSLGCDRTGFLIWGGTRTAQAR